VDTTWALSMLVSGSRIYRYYSEGGKHTLTVASSSIGNIYILLSEKGNVNMMLCESPSSPWREDSGDTIRGYRYLIWKPRVGV